MIYYATVGSNDFSKSIPFFDELLATQGLKMLFEHPNGGGAYGNDEGVVLGVFSPFDGKPATCGNGTMLAFNLPTREDVDAFHAKALSLGAADEGAPGERGPGFYMSYFRDLDGNKFCACKMG